MIGSSGLYIKNNYKFKEINENSVGEQIKNILNKKIINYMKVNPPTSQYKIYSSGKKKIDYSIYTGTGGNMYVYWRYHLLNKHKGYTTEKTLNYFLDSFNTNLKIVIDEENSNQFNKFNQNSSFFFGQQGVYTMGCIIANEMKDEDLFAENLKGVRKYKELALSFNSEDELLYGNAGYLYSLSLIYKNCILHGNFKSYADTLQKDMNEVIEFLYDVGLEKKNEKKTDMLVYPFPRNESKMKPSKIYLGGAHGIFGILYEILVAIQLLGNSLTDKSQMIKNEIKKDLFELIKLQFTSGNFPTSINKSSDDLIQFCHGAPGAVYLYGLGYVLYNENLFLEVALKCGETVWERGILKKGNGICHGITGNAYSLFYLYKITKNNDWMKKAYCFTLASFDENIQSICRESDHPQRFVKGIPDTPNSLMEGEGGMICLYSDLLNGDDFVIFPGYEV